MSGIDENSSMEDVLKHLKKDKEKSEERFSKMSPEEQLWSKRAGILWFRTDHYGSVDVYCERAKAAYEERYGPIDAKPYLIEGPSSPLSLEHPCAIQLDANSFSSALHALQYVVARDHLNPRDAEAIAKTENPDERREIVKNFEFFSFWFFDAKYAEWLLEVNRAKFDQNADLKALLEDTAPAIIRERPIRDHFLDLVQHDWSFGEPENGPISEKEKSERYASFLKQDVLGWVLTSIREGFQISATGPRYSER